MTTRTAADVFEGFSTRPIHYTPPDSDFVACNPSVHFDGTTWRVVLRCINYRLGREVPEQVYSKNVMVVLDPSSDWSTVSSHPMTDLSGRTPSDFPIHGFEDCRLFQWQGKLWMSGTCCDLAPGPFVVTPRLIITAADWLDFTRGYGNRTICLLELDSEYAIVACTPLRGPWSDHYQKNWIPCPQNGRLTFVYSVDRALVIGVGDDGLPGAICMEDGNRKHVADVHRWVAIGNHRGSSQGIRLRTGQWLYLVHEEGYRSQFVLAAGESYRPQRVSEPFYFGEVGQVEFSAGMALDEANRQLVVSYSRRDASVDLGFFPFESVMASMRKIEDGWAWRP